MSHEIGVKWKIRIKKAEMGKIEIEVVGMDLDTTKKWFDELQKKYIG